MTSRLFQFLPSPAAISSRLTLPTTPFSLFLLLAVVSASAQRFPPLTVFPSGSQPAVVAIADVNGDGNQDIFVLNFPSRYTGTYVLSVLLGNGKGGFQAPKTIATLPDALPIVTADFNGDGKPDLAVFDATGGRVLVYLNTGGGNFSAPKISFTGAPAIGDMAAGDINGDGKPDLVVGATGSGGAFRLLLGEGNGFFRTPVTVLPGADPIVNLTVGDVNHDGHLDVAGVSAARGVVYLGNGDGTFREGGDCGAANYNAGQGQVILADLQGNGNLDLAVSFVGYVLVCPGNGDGTYGKGVPYNGGYFPDLLASADMNGDGKLDLITLDVDTSTVTVLLNRGDGSLISPAIKYATPSTTEVLNVGDFHNNGRPDVIVSAEGGVNVLTNLGGGILHAPVSIEPTTGQAPPDYLDAVFATDFDKDGHLDLAVAGYYDNSVSAEVSNVPLLFGSGKATFVAGSDPIGPGSVPVTNIFPTRLAIGDFNGDGKPDLAASLTNNSGMQYISIAYNSGTHTFSAGPKLNLPNEPAYFVAGDFNRDGYSDFAVLDGNDVDIYLNRKNGSYSGPISYHVGTNPSFIVQRDLNGDGKLDLIVTNHDSDDVSILLGKGDGTFAAAASYPASAHPNVVTTGDFNRDGKLDLAVGGDSVAVLLGRGDGTFENPTEFSAPHPVTFLTQADLRGTGIEDLLCVGGELYFSNQIYVLYGKGDGSFNSPTAYGTEASPSWLTVGDFNSDGAIDVAVSTSTAITLLLNQGGTYISLKSSATTISAGQTVTFTATLTGSVPGAGRPSGTIAFKDGAKGIGFVKVIDGKATFTTSSLSKGSHVITASYWGNGFFNPHVSKSVSETVQ